MREQVVRNVDDVGLGVGDGGGGRGKGKTRKTSRIGTITNSKTSREASIFLKSIARKRRLTMTRGVSATGFTRCRSGGSAVGMCMFNELVEGHGELEFEVGMSKFICISGRG